MQVFIYFEFMMSIEELYQLFVSSKGLEIDSRKVEDNMIFCAFKGERTDGHKYVEQVVQSNKAWALIDNENYLLNSSTILVDDVLSTIQKLAVRHRKEMNNPVIGITGSNGKTTTKELIHAVLSSSFSVYATKGNYNNHLGVPLTILNAPLDSDMWIIEMGANHIGEIHDLCQIANPNYGLITNIGYAHIEGFGSFQGIIKGKTELYNHLFKNNGVIFYNRNDEILSDYLEDYSDILPYPNPELTIKDSGLKLKLEIENFTTYSDLYGTYNGINIHAAFAIGDYFKIEHNTILKAIQSYKPKMNRSELVSFNNIKIIKDAYNANPSSMKVSINNLVNLETDLSKSLIIGDMKELGEDKIQMHQDIADLINLHNWKNIILIGEIFSKISCNNARRYLEVDDAIKDLKSNTEIFHGSIVLLKASRSIGLEKLMPLFS